MNNIDTLNEVGKKIVESFEVLLDTILKRPLSLDEIVDVYSRKTDNYIVEIEQNEKLKFIAGKFFIIRSGEKYNTKADLYFQDIKDDSWNKKELKGSINPENISTEAKKLLSDQEPKQYDILHPKR